MPSLEQQEAFLLAETLSESPPLYIVDGVKVCKAVDTWKRVGASVGRSVVIRARRPVKTVQVAVGVIEARMARGQLVCTSDAEREWLRECFADACMVYIE